jgi:hypothetical protein
MNIDSTESGSESENNTSDEDGYVKLKRLCELSKKLVGELDDKKYKIILNFINDLDLVDFKVKGLTDIKKISKENIKNNMEDKKKIILKHISKLKRDAGLRVRITEKTKIEDIDDKYAIYIIRRSLGIIGLKVKRRGDSFSIVHK